MCKHWPSTMTQFTNQHHCTALWCCSFWCCSALWKPVHTSDCPLWREKYFMSCAPEHVAWSNLITAMTLCSCSCLPLAFPHFRLPGHILSNDLPWKVYGMQHHCFPNNIMFFCNVSVCMQVFAHSFLFIIAFAVRSNLPSSMEQVLPSALHCRALIPHGLVMNA